MNLEPVKNCFVLAHMVYGRRTYINGVHELISPPLFAIVTSGCSTIKILLYPYRLPLPLFPPGCLCIHDNLLALRCTLPS